MTKNEYNKTLRRKVKEAVREEIRIRNYEASSDARQTKLYLEEAQKGLEQAKRNFALALGYGAWDGLVKGGMPATQAKAVDQNIRLAWRMAKDSSNKTADLITLLRGHIKWLL